jgi:hypothetical protein
MGSKVCFFWKTLYRLEKLCYGIKTKTSIFQFPAQICLWILVLAEGFLRE